MAQGFHRVAVAIVLMATLLLPYGRCQSPSRAAAHDCCKYQSAPAASVGANCCTVRSELPAIVVERAVVDPHAVTIQSPAVPANDSAAICLTPVAPALSQHSPPPGKSILRI
jgi:hypothetical protein